DLLMVPFWGRVSSASRRPDLPDLAHTRNGGAELGSPGRVAGELRRRGVPADAHLAYHQSTVVAALTFAELVRFVLPLAYLRKELGGNAAGWLRIPELGEPERNKVIAALVAFERGRMDQI